MNNHIKTFISAADIGLITAIQTACRRKFPQTVEAFDALTESEISAIKRGGLKCLPQHRLDQIAVAMEGDNFIFSQI